MGKAGIRCALWMKLKADPAGIVEIIQQGKQPLEIDLAAAGLVTARHVRNLDMCNTVNKGGQHLIGIFTGTQ